MYSGDDRETFSSVSCSFKQCPIKGQNNEADKQDGENDKNRRQVCVKEEYLEGEKINEF